MALLRTLLSRRFLQSHLNPKIPHTFFHPSTLYPFKFKSPHRPFTTLPQTEDPVASKPQTDQNKKPLSAFFIEALGLSEKTLTSNKEEEDEEEGEGKGEIELKKKLKQLAEEVKSFKENAKGVPKKAERRSLYALFTNQPSSVSIPKEEKLKRKPMVVKELSPDMVMFVQFLYENGYFNDANFVQGKKSFDLSWFESFFARGYIKFAAQKFGRDKQEIAKWLSGSALKQVAEFGCPAIDRSSVFPAKILRKFFEVPENTVCSKCMLRESCKFANKSVWKCDTNKLDLVIVMKVITPYALEFVHPQLVVSDQVTKSVSQLLNEVVKLSQTT